MILLFGIQVHQPLIHDLTVNNNYNSTNKLHFDDDDDENGRKIVVSVLVALNYHFRLSDFN